MKNKTGEVIGNSYAKCWPPMIVLESLTTIGCLIHMDVLMPRVITQYGLELSRMIQN